MTPEQRSLLNKAQKSLDASQELMEKGFYDFAISRAYYAMFYVAEALLDQEGLSFSSHAAVIGAFGKHLARTGKVPVELHRQLIDAQSLRTSADYDSFLELSQIDAETVIQQAQGFIYIGFQNLS